MIFVFLFEFQKIDSIFLPTDKLKVASCFMLYQTLRLIFASVSLIPLKNM